MNKIIFTFTIFLILIGFGNYSFAVTEEPVVVIETSLGNIVIELFPAYATEHVKNFLALASNGYYDSTLFHRIIPGFMIQGGDPNTKSGEPNTWGQGGPDTKLDAEFNPIKHNRGIVSMARSADPNSAGSQFFIVHQDSNFLDGEYTAFGRLASQESFETLDKIAAVTTGASDRPVDPEQVRIIKATIIATADVSGYIPYVEPERTGTITPPTESIANQVFESKELDITFSAPVGWLLQQPDSSISGAPDVAAVGPKVDGVNPVISLTIKDQVDKTIDELITEKNNVLAEAVYLNKLEILAQEKIKTNIYQTEAIGNFEVDDKTLQIKFLEVMILSEQKSYTFAYSNTVDNFNNDLPKFQESLDSFRILSQESPIMTPSEDKSSEEGGGCLIATAAYGSEMAPQVQMLREIRDNQLMNTESGTAFMGAFNNVYYSFSPVIADYERENPYFKEAVKIAIAPMLSSLSIMENANSESEVLGLGLSVIALNLAMYLGVPAIAVVGIKRKF
ncbi:MAG: peptidylprolyl isomerase [Nitrosopumilus sp.]|nr:peptidylprolyl isomerase [Nitrosopumilus sp.]